MINLSLDELTAQIRNISGYENKSKEDLIKALKAGFHSMLIFQLLLIFTQVQIFQLIRK